MVSRFLLSMLFRYAEEYPAINGGDARRRNAAGEVSPPAEIRHELYLYQPKQKLRPSGRSILLLLSCRQRFSRLV